MYGVESRRRKGVLMRKYIRCDGAIFGKMKTENKF